MINKEEAFEKAFKIKSDMLAKKKAVYDAEYSRLLMTNERFSEITKELSAKGFSVATVAISGDIKEFQKLQNEIEALSKEKEAILENDKIKKIKFDCEKCCDTGYVGGAICDCVKLMAKNIILSDLSTELPLNESKFEKFDLSYYPDTDNENGNPRRRMEQIFALCFEYAKNFNPNISGNLLFMGSAGLGKTHLSLSIAGELICKGFDVIYGSSYNLFSQMENEHFSDRTNESYNAAVGCDLLIIDDLGSEFLSPYIRSMIYNVINTRLLSKLPTIINTNLSMSEIEEKYTARISSRLVGNYKAKKFIGNDIRQQRFIENNR